MKPANLLLPIFYAFTVLLVCLLAGHVGEKLVGGFNLGSLTGWLANFGALTTLIGFSGRRRLLGGAWWVAAAWLAVGLVAVNAKQLLPYLVGLIVVGFLIFAAARGAGRKRRIATVLVALAAFWLVIESALDVAYPAYQDDSSTLPERVRTWNLAEHTNLFGNYDDAEVVNLRGGPMSMEKPAGVKRVLCLGSSSTWGPGLEPEQTYPQRLGRILGPRYEVGNAGWSGYNSFQLAIYLEQVLLRLQPDLVIFY